MVHMGRPEIFKIFIACADCNIECSICWISWPSVDFLDPTLWDIYM